MAYKDIEKRDKWVKAYYQKRKALGKTYNAHQHRGQQLKRKFGMTWNDYKAMWIAQNGECAICHVYQYCLKKALEVDHDHKTGKVRGLLCTRCNKGIGTFKDNATLLRNAINYLERNNDNNTRN